MLDPIGLGPGPCADGVLSAALSYHLGTNDLQELRIEVRSLNLRALPSWDLLLSSPTALGGSMAFCIILGKVSQEWRDVTDVLLSSLLCQVQTQELHGFQGRSCGTLRACVGLQLVPCAHYPCVI